MIPNWKDSLRDLIENGYGVEFGLELRHLTRICEAEVSENCVEFVLTRHPHVFGQPTLGEPSSGYVPTVQRYRLILQPLDLQLLSEEHEEPKIDWELMMVEADNLIDSVFDDVKRRMSKSGRLDLNTWMECARAEFNKLDFSSMIDALPEGCPISVLTEYREKALDRLLEQVTDYVSGNL